MCCCVLALADFLSLLICVYVREGWLNFYIEKPSLELSCKRVLCTFVGLQNKEKGVEKRVLWPFAENFIQPNFEPEQSPKRLTVFNQCIKQQWPNALHLQIENL